MEELKYIFQQVNDWLRFAEAKNLALLVFNSTMLIGSSGIATNYLINSKEWIFWICILILLIANLASLIMVFVSINPITKNIFDLTKSHENKYNLFFYRDISGYKPEQYIKGLEEKYNIKIDKMNIAKAEDLAKQIAINSNIACFKFRWFQKALYLTGLGVSSSGSIFITSLLFSFLKLILK
jgi:hypothetical protein